MKFIFLGKITSLQQPLADVRASSRVSIVRGDVRIGGAKISLRITLHDILLDLDADYDISVDSAFEMAERAVENYINALAFFTGMAYEFLTTSLILPNGQFLPALRRIPAFLEEMARHDITYIDFFELGNSRLFRAIDEFRNALKSLRDKGFHSFRAVEAIRKHFDELEGVEAAKSKTKGWNRLNSDLIIEGESSILIANNFALEQRHGGLIYMDANASKSTLDFTRECILRFAVYLKRGCVPLDKGEFELLKYSPSRYRTFSEIFDEEQGD
jgi:hypothetical protein